MLPEGPGKDVIMSEKGTEANEAEIAVHWKEEEYFHPSKQFIEQANLTDPAVFDRMSLEHFPDCFDEYADLLTWYKPWHTTLDTSDAPCWKWYVGGEINACFNRPSIRKNRYQRLCLWREI